MKTIYLIIFSMAFICCGSAYSLDFVDSRSNFDDDFLNWPYKEDSVVFAPSLCITYIAIMPLDICSFPFYSIYCLLGRGDEHSFTDNLLGARGLLLDEYIINIGFPIYCLVSTSVKVPKFILFDIPQKIARQCTGR